MTAKQGTPINLRCNSTKAFNLTMDQPDIIGHILAFKFTNSGVDLDTKFDVSDPENPDSKKPVIGVFNYYKWDRSKTSEHFFDIQFHVKNAGKFRQTVNSQKGGSETTADYVLYKYDYSTNKYFQYFKTEGAKDFAFTKGAEMIVEDDLGPVESPKNQRCAFYMTPSKNFTFSVAEVAGSPESVEAGIS